MSGVTATPLPSTPFHLPHDHSTYIQGSATFAFRKRWGQIDWRKLASVDVDRIAKEMDFQALQQNIVNVTFCNIQAEEFQNLDSNFIKLFRLSQLIVEYLLHSQQYLSSQTTALELQLQQANQVLDKTLADIKSSRDELKAVKKENHKRRKVIEAYQDMINAGATGLHSCPVCNREFVSKEYLQSHIHRRHPNQSELRNGKQQPTQENLETRVMEQLTEQLLISEKQLREEMKQKEQEAMNSQIKEFEDWKEKEKKRMTIEMEEFKRPLYAELNDLRQEKTKLEKIIQEKEAELLETQTKRLSHLGQLEGARELALDDSNQQSEYKAEIKHLKETFEVQIQNMQAALQKQDMSWKKRMQKLSASYQDQLKESVAKLESVEHSVLEGSQSDAASKKVSVKIKSLQQRMKQQEELLQSQQEQLTTLQSREPSPVHNFQDGQSHLESGDGDSQDDNSDDNDGDMVLSENFFIPFPHQPNIKTKYNHNQEDMEKIRQQTRAIFSDTLVQKGLIKDAAGLSNSEFEKKINMLHQERERKIRAHYHFDEHRKGVVQDIGKLTAADYKPVSVQELMQQISSSRPKHKSAIESKGRPPKPTTKIIISQTDECATGTAREFSTNMDSVKPNQNHCISGPYSKVNASSDSLTSSGDLSSSVIISHNFVQAVAGDESLVAGTESKEKPIAVKQSGEKNNSWDSEDDSFGSISPDGRTSSTPIKVFSDNKPVAANPTKTPKLAKQDDLYMDSFDSSDLSAPLTTKKNSQSIKVLSFKPHSKNGTSQSALTSVSMDDFDSDISDLDLT